MGALRIVLTLALLLAAPLAFAADPLSIPAITLGKGVDVEQVQREAHMMGELIGLGLNLIHFGLNTIRLDF